MPTPALTTTSAGPSPMTTDRDTSEPPCPVFPRSCGRRISLIQRKSGDPAEVVRLARSQERELRGWLYAGPIGSQATLASAVTEVAHEVEDLHGIPIELVVTGDRALDAGGAALVRALREASESRSWAACRGTVARQHCGGSSTAPRSPSPCR